LNFSLIRDERMTPSFWIYNLLLHGALLLGWPVLAIVLLIHSKLRHGLLQRFGYLPKEARSQLWVGEGCVWLHAASLGEVNALLPVAHSLLQHLPSEAFIFTCTTLTGVARAKQGFPEARAHALLPLDSPLFLRPMLLKYQPRLCVIAETELWPNFIRLLKQQRCRVLVANGRLTQRSFERYQWFSALFQEVTRKIDCFAMQSAEDALRIKALGANAQKVTVTGNTKYDAVAAIQAETPEVLKAKMGLGAHRRVLIAGSTRPGEEGPILEAFANARPSVKDASKAWALIVAPRHLERLDEVLALLKASGLAWQRRSQAGAIDDSIEVVVLDTMGELAGLYACADLALIGGSFADFGGQNPLEAAAQGVPVFMGASMRHFRDIAADLLHAGGARTVESFAGLAAALKPLLADPKALRGMGAAGKALVSSRLGASQRTAEMALKLYAIDKLYEQQRHWRDESAFKALQTKEFGSAAERPNEKP
jgi:3-deoxy-D-manno-octulosonic-acid transferase